MAAAKASSRPRRLRFIEPMKATLAPAPPYNGQWRYEVKFDGFRILAVKNGKEVELWSRNEKLLNERFPEIAAAVARLPVAQCIVDGEVCALNEAGISSFQLIQNYAATPAPIVYYAFDLPFLGSDDLRGVPLEERQERLSRLLAKAKNLGPIRPSAWFEEKPEKVLAAMRKHGGEGAIAKLKGSIYETGHRSPAWIKIKFNKSQEFLIVGYTLPQKSRKWFGSLALAYHDGKRLVFAGRVGTGFTSKSLAQIYKLMKPLEIEAPACEQVQEPGGRWRPKGWKPSQTRWLKPKLVGQVQFTEWTGDGILRHPSFLGLRDDKDPGKIVREPSA